ncbi:MAG: DUF2182 domain-containing protein [Chloroflexota bacterium]|nr:DUF2182 domain-containing protein [Chloroflexota bacterium]
MERGRFVLLLVLALLTIAAWALTVYQARTMDMPMGVAVRGGASSDMAEPAESSGMVMPEMAMAGMASKTWSLNGFGAFLGAWAVMMAAMMLPAATPMILLFNTVYAKRRAQGNAFVPTWVFAAGYLLVWSAIGGAVYALVQLGSEVSTRLGTADREAWAPLALGATLVVAGVYQATPLKRVCLLHCQSPLGFVMRHWREGRLGALWMGVRHGAFCLGCCWALFAVLVAAGVMSLAWMLLLTLVIFAEKVLPHGRSASLAVGVVLAGLGVLVATGATGMPWIA